ncbi:MAG: nicotinate-nucleotide--dimethylbenzimidazole phosphoribosyltransferase [Bryobacterales bacterium]|nr:nicotinate-nucleotide--dimethylbenzimidazole phosphoribosyltransferase [Bryobacterales bacterium]
MTPQLQSAIAAIRNPQDVALEAQVQARLNSLTKPPGSLGRLEELAQWYCLCRGEALPAAPRKALAVFCGDHGVTAEGVSAYPADVTALMAANFSGGGAAINVLCRKLGIETTVIDVGIASALDPALDVLHKKVAPGTANFAADCAMTDAQRDAALAVGLEIAQELACKGVTLAAAGEMGIGNTTSAAALGAALTGASPDKLAGPGTGVDQAGRARKAAVIEMALDLHNLSDRDPLRALACVGGLEIAAMAGFYLGCGAARVPVVVDGFIATSAALVAVRLAPALRSYFEFGHRSAEPGHALLLDALGAAPLLELEMRLGEGTGAALGMDVVDAAVALYREMATFESAGISA